MTLTKLEACVGTVAEPPAATALTVFSELRCAVGRRGGS